MWYNMVNLVWEVYAIVLIGEFQHNIDAKGRLTMPAKFRQDLGQTFIITRGLDGCLAGYSLENWEQLQQKLKELSSLKKDARKFLRFLYSAATEAEIDKQGRINLPQALIEHAGLEKECRVVGVSDRIEIWSSDRWEAFVEETEEDFEDLAESLMEF